MPDCLLEYLRRCGGRDVLTFETEQAARLARDVITVQMDKDDIEFIKRPSLRLFECELHLDLPKNKEIDDAALEQATKVR